MEHFDKNIQRYFWNDGKVFRFFFFFYNVAGSGARALLALIAKTRRNMVKRMSKEAAS